MSSMHIPVFTVLMLILISSFATLTKTHKSEIDNKWLRRMGFAPNDIWINKLHKLFLSALVTEGRQSYIQALVLIALFVGSLEIMTKTWYVLICFWGIHVTTLSLVSSIIILAKHANHSLSTELFFSRDVGPSAGYFGCLGILIGHISTPWNVVLIILICLAITIYMLLPQLAYTNKLMKLHADLAHFVAVIIGFVVGIL